MALVSTKFNTDQFAAWRTHSIAAFARDKVEAGTWTSEEADLRAIESFDQLLPVGMNTVGHAIRRVVTAEDHELRGWFWVGPATDSAPGTGWLFDIEIVPTHRGRGLGREVMALVETEARRLGYARIGLHVFAHNPVARQLYESCDYHLTDLCYAKTLR